MPMAAARLSALVETLRARPGHEKVRALLHELCVVGLDVADRDVDFEIPVPEVRGRIDAVLGATVFECKRDLRHEAAEAEGQLTRYLSEREKATGRRFLGIATDGATFSAYELVSGRLVKLEDHLPNESDPRALLQWLDTAITVRADLKPDPTSIRAEFGRDSLVFRRAIQQLRELWAQAQSVPEAALKHQLWSRHLEFVYGTLVEPEELFLQHTYLTAIAKTMALRVLVHGPIAPRDLLAGTPFSESGLNGAIETDFFDWPLLVPGGDELIDRLANQVGRFRLAEIEVDVLKGLYESLIDPRQRHYLGEYYTPDWLADWMCREAVPDPLAVRVLDPACGSGTFLFHSVRRYVDAAEKAGTPLQEVLEQCAERVVGVDVHPVAVLFARVTYLFAIGPDRLRARTGPINIPVYLGDALQWDVRQLLSEEEIEIAVPGEPPLRFPGAVAGNPTILDAVLRAMRELADGGASTTAFESWLNANTRLPETDRKILAESYTHLRELHEARRNHIWTFIVRNLTRPLWLSLREAKPDVLIGNPPWLRFNAMSKWLQNRFRQASQERGLWVGGRVATHQDLSAYFFARCVERYLKNDGKIAFVMPFACLSRTQYEGFRKGRYADRRGNLATIVRFDQVWTFDSNVQPLFPVPSAVIFGHRAVTSAPLPQQVAAFRGHLPSRDASPKQARSALRRNEEPWPLIADGESGSQYRKNFKQGATVVPRRLFVVEPVTESRFGIDRSAPLMTSRVGAQDKKPWKDLVPLRGQIEKRFLKSLYLGESIAPFRVRAPLTAIIPIDGRREELLTSKSAIEAGYPHLGRWLKQAESLWREHGPAKLSLNQQLDYYGKLLSQFPLASVRVVYAKAGMNPAAAIIHDDRGIIDHKLYWMSAKSMGEARYLVAILNSEAARQRIEGLQSEGQFGRRDFDKVVFTLPIPKFQKGDALHEKLAAAAERAEAVAEAVAIGDDAHFQTARRAVRDALTGSGVLRVIDGYVDELLSTGLRSKPRAIA